MYGAVLVQNTSWKNVERAIDNLREAELLEPRRLWAAAPEELAELVRPAGYYRLKTNRLRNLLEFLITQYDASLEALQSADLAELREQLLRVRGIGPETADSILLYALHRPVLVVDTYTYRVFARHGWIDVDADYHELQQHLVSELPEDSKLYNELHALLVNVGHHHCRRTPKCEACPLFNLLPESGIVSPV